MGSKAKGATVERQAAPRRRALIPLLSIGVIALALAAPAPAATTLGASPPGTGGPISCNANIMFAQLSVADGPRYQAPPEGGVITRWRTTASGTAGLAVFVSEVIQFKLIAEDIRELPGTPVEFATRIPVPGDAMLGVKTTTAGDGCLWNTPRAADVAAGSFAVLSVPPHR